MEATKQKNLVRLGITAAALLALNFAGSYVFKRFDLTADKRYTLSEASVAVTQKVQEPLYIDIFLGGDLPPEFKRLQNEIRQLLEEYQVYNSNIIFNFIDPLAEEEDVQNNIQELYQMGLTPTNIEMTRKGKRSVIQIFPWAIANVGQHSVKVPLLVNNFMTNKDENINKSVQLLEYNFSDAITKLTITDRKKVAVLKGNGEIADRYMSDFLLGMKEYYALGEFNLDSLSNDRQKTLQNLQRFDLAVIAKPTQAFTEDEKAVIDQYIMNGGKTLWMVDRVSMDLDSLRNSNNAALAYPADLNLDDMLFKYGVRLNANLVQDLLSTPISVQSANGEAPVDWPYSPVVRSRENHPINKNINIVKLEFAGQIDTLKNNIKKTALLQSSPESKVVGMPAQVNLYQFLNNVNPSQFNNGNQVLGVLLEGKFTSAYKNRLKPVKFTNPKDDGADNKMIVIADGDIVNYKYANKKPLGDGIDPWLQQTYSNRDFLLNCVNYLLDDNGLIKIRSKNINLHFLDAKKVEENYAWAQLITIGLPLAVLAIFGVLFTYLRKRAYTKRL
ncbi:gliding motility-associated ABC transporter substrate-binding protein GldG [Flavobacterium sp. Sd200]|uniref:gliding motility-associated ABC transporter substrate-binding protein GldG n=1 Tax=Flavobacterium sp. Sd200 TaxID=2692211 RepID=UPI00136920B6|nr:gliding motility-associated ABC transporter substrate-binding protein GldG [Flavobacterium sp. Sd200]MXN89911.1 gliding motility-associated ABC transporter substrate-binding protein GldG [Flavobacterium sp. Sd200]